MPVVPPDGAGAVVPPDGAGAVAWASASEAVSTSAGNAKPNAAASPRRKNASRREIICDLIFSLISQSPYFDPPPIASEARVHERALNRSGSAVTSPNMRETLQRLPERRPSRPAKMKRDSIQRFCARQGTRDQEVFENECGLTAMQRTERRQRNDFTSGFLLVVSADEALLGRSLLFDGEPIEPASTTPARG